ncbi:MAG: hypothetical protein Q8R58_07830 [Sulfuricurvum sp.]|nr:hypothetical protein [Sulfuricurvum sp.]
MKIKLLLNKYISKIPIFRKSDNNISIKEIFKQLLKEYWLPFIASIIWTLYAKKSDEYLTTAVGTFAATFFFLSWLNAQFFRVTKQMKVEKSFVNVEERLKNLIITVEDRTNNLLNVINEEDSYLEGKLNETYFYHIHKVKNDSFLIMPIDFIHHGNAPLTFVDIKLQFGNFNVKDNKLFANGVTKSNVGHLSTQYLYDIQKDQNLIMIFYITSKKSWLQRIVINKKNDYLYDVDSDLFFSSVDSPIHNNYKIKLEVN